MFWKSYFSYFNLLVKLRFDNKKSSATKDELYIYINRLKIHLYETKKL